MKFFSTSTLVAVVPLAATASSSVVPYAKRNSTSNSDTGDIIIAYNITDPYYSQYPEQFCAAWNTACSFLGVIVRVDFTVAISFILTLTHSNTHSFHSGRCERHHWHRPVVHTHQQLDHRRRLLVRRPAWYYRCNGRCWELVRRYPPPRMRQLERGGDVEGAPCCLDSDVLSPPLMTLSRCWILYFTTFRRLLYLY